MILDMLSGGMEWRYLHLFWEVLALSPLLLYYYGEQLREKFCIELWQACDKCRAGNVDECCWREVGFNDHISLGR